MKPDRQSRDTFFHAAYGGAISSSIPLPELREIEPGAVRWDFRVVDSLAEMVEPTLLGEEPIYAEVSARLFSHRTGHRIQIDDTGSFDISADLSLIRWEPLPDPWWDFGRSHLIGRVLATALHLDGILTLHASAVRMGDGVIAFLAPKHFGKSTLAMYLHRAGAHFVTDDSLPVETADRIRALPGIHSLRVRADDADAEHLLGFMPDGEAGRDGKIVLPPIPAERALHTPAPLAALYLLSPQDVMNGDGRVAVRRRPIEGIEATLFLLGQLKIGAMLGSRAVPDLLGMVSEVAGRVPVHRLEIARDLERLPDVVSELVDWHGLPGDEGLDDS